MLFPQPHLLCTSQPHANQITTVRYEVWAKTQKAYCVRSDRLALAVRRRIARPQAWLFQSRPHHAHLFARLVRAAAKHPGLSVRTSASISKYARIRYVTAVRPYLGARIKLTWRRCSRYRLEEYCSRQYQQNARLSASATSPGASSGSHAVRHEMVR